MPNATVVITTKDRRDDLRKALASACRQVGDIAVLVVDDGSTDGTSDMVREEFPSVELVRMEDSLGYIAARNLAARVAKSDFIVSIDDDAEFSSPNTVEQVLKEFSDETIGAVAMPYINVRMSPKVLQRAPDDDAVIYATGSFVGTAHAVRRRVFLALGGYREVFFHQGEEGDFCIRLLDAGYVVRLGRSTPILHYVSPKRDHWRLHAYGPRNLVLFAWFNVPARYLPAHMAGTHVKALVHGIRVSRLLTKLEGLCMGWAAVVRGEKGRRPVSSRAYGLYRRLGGRTMELTSARAALTPGGVRQ